MIGAGVGWFVLRHPPITSALVGYGLYSLLRTDASPQPAMRTQDYLDQGQQRLKQQASTVALAVTEHAEAAAERAGSVATAARDKVVAKSNEVFHTAKNSAVGFAHDIRAQAEPLAKDEEVRDRALLSVAGAAVAAALLIAWQKRMPADG
jgi:hypothetical protein